MKRSLVILCSVLIAQAASAVLISGYVESGGVVVGEGELFSNRVDAPGLPKSWTEVPTESASSGSFSNFRGTGFVQLLPDNGNNGTLTPNIPPEIHYTMDIQTLGTYQLFLRWDPRPNGGAGGQGTGQSDSMFADIIELKDGSGGTIADHYEFVHGGPGDFSSTPWDGTGGFETNNAGGTPKVPATWAITSPGLHTLRFTMREDGAAVDAFVFQLDSLAAPTGLGPAVSALIPVGGVPEPSTLLQLGTVMLGMLYLRRRRRV